MEQGINVIYKLAESPDSICGDLIKKLTQESCQLEKTPEKDGEQKEGDAEQKGNDTEQTDGDMEQTEGDPKQKEGEGDGENEQMEEGGDKQGTINIWKYLIVKFFLKIFTLHSIIMPFDVFEISHV